MNRTSRRRVLLAGATALVAFAGCRGDGAGTTETGTDTAVDASATTEQGSWSTDHGTPTESTLGVEGESTATGAGTATDRLDLREANVVGVEFETDDGHRFSVTLFHDDDGEEAYANWWQVERLDGTQLGRRTLLHAHSTDPFTRSETIDVPDDVTCVVVRGHDRTHGYGGRAVLVNLDTGATRAVDQGTERLSFDESDCP